MQRVLQTRDSLPCHLGVTAVPLAILLAQSAKNTLRSQSWLRAGQIVDFSKIGAVCRAVYKLLVFVALKIQYRSSSNSNLCFVLFDSHHLNQYDAWSKDTGVSGTGL